MRYKDFNLKSTNFSKFKVAEFERKIYGRHLARMRAALRAGKFFDFIITVIPENNTWMIVDGQHRFMALKTLIKELKLKEFPVTLRILEEKELGSFEPREIYLALDSGKNLTGMDILKVFDDGKIPFFPRLKRWCGHYGHSGRVSFFNMLVAHHYAMTGDTFLRKQQIKTALESISNEDLSKLEFLISNLNIVIGNKDHFMYRAINFRNVTKVLFDHPELVGKQSKFQAFLKGLATDSMLETVRLERAADSYKDVYFHMQRRMRKGR